MSDHAVSEIDPELGAMTKVLAALQPLASDARVRVTRWVIDKLEMQSLVAEARKPLVEPKISSSPAPAAPSARLELGIGTIAAKLEAKSGADLALAAAAYLTFAQGKSRISRKEIWEAMQMASGYFKKSAMGGGNYSRSLQTLVRSGQLNEVSTDMYTIAAKEAATLRGKLD